MAKQAVAREAVRALRLKIASIEGRLPERLAMPVSPARAAGPQGVVLRRGGPEPADVLLPADALLSTGLLSDALLSTGAGRFDAALGGGLPLAALIELHGRATRDAGAVAGFALGLAARVLRAGAPVLWVAAGEALSEAGSPHAPGLASRFAIPPAALLVAPARRLEDALWIAEEAAALTAFSAVMLEVRGHAPRLDLTATRRLHRRARQAGRPVLLLRQAGASAPTAAPVRLVVAPAPAGERRVLSGRLASSIGPPAFAVTIARSRMAIPATVTLEWNDDERAFFDRAGDGAGTQDHGAVVSMAGERAHPARAAGTVLAFGGAA